MNLVVVIAAYNEAANLPPLTCRLIRSLGVVEGCRWKIIYVIEGNDGSRDIVEKLSREYPQIRLIYGPRPSGLGNAFRKGFEAVPGDTDVLVTMDADLNHQPEEIDRLVRALVLHQADIIVGSRKVAGSSAVGVPVWKRTLSDALNSLMKKLMAMPVSDQTSGFRVYRYSSFRQLAYTNAGFAFLPELLIEAHRRGLAIREEPIDFIFRKAGSSKMSIVSTSVSYLRFLRRLVLRADARSDRARAARRDL